jgi:uncharacterized NAD(P)/FAD-binding protein YdhS
MAKNPRYRIVIVGGGASGALMAAHLLRGDPQNVSVTIVETRAELGRGLAYATGNPRHLLNVRAANMSAFADDPDHFARWLSNQVDEPHFGGDPEFRFVSRNLYGRYLESLVLDRLSGPSGRGVLTVVRDLAREIAVTDTGVEVALEEGPAVRAEVAILACGHESVEAQRPPYVSPWAEPVGGGAPLEATLLILGTGLTMVDTALALEAKGHRGRIVAVSRRGLLPAAHVKVDPLPIEERDAPFDAPLSDLLHWLRALAKETQTNGREWRSVVDGLRPHTQSIWRAMSARRRKRFLEHARPWWDTHRHRMAPEVAARIHGMIASKRLEIIAGKVVEVAPMSDGARVSLRRRGLESVESIDVFRIISCTGVRSDPEQSANPLVESLFAQGLARVDTLRIGIEVAPNCAILNREGEASQRLFAIGPMSQAAFWEIIAVPDIRLQTAALAKDLMDHFLPTPYGRSTQADEDVLADGSMSEQARSPGRTG